MGGRLISAHIFPKNQFSGGSTGKSPPPPGAVPHVGVAVQTASLTVLKNLHCLTTCPFIVLLTHPPNAHPAGGSHQSSASTLAVFESEKAKVAARNDPANTESSRDRRPSILIIFLLSFHSFQILTSQKRRKCNKKKIDRSINLLRRFDGHIKYRSSKLRQLLLAARESA